MILHSTFLFIGTTEVMFILFIVVMVFGADKIPDIARGMGKGMRTLRDATNDLKSEITKTAEKNGINTTEHTKAFTDEVQKVKDELEETIGSVKRKL
ncbi:Sec-independent protein translocase subunit TatA/TatB [Gelidibacter gilvus]|uniref:Sec-independent protein translocase protein TatA n=1 Tax=Gelidibacter gilvus TaxID=59602 RepID=A0A4Q0XH74_9FLAO|nr:twin-arginine translocase TatA/TatE family subunit [Gelidibacter gilvus]RXJ46116.1 twin-arginine translocase TatA/TatE family subunit [Gelidibacter gilvus]